MLLLRGCVCVVVWHNVKRCACADTVFMWGRWMGVMATPLGVQEKISKINAELARLELEMELDHETHDQLGFKLSDLNPFANSKPDDSVVNADVKVFQELIFLEVAVQLKIATDLTSLGNLLVASGSSFLTNRLKPGDIHPSCIWRFTRVPQIAGGASGNPKVLFLFFWAGTDAHYSVYESVEQSSKFDFGKMSVSKVWKSNTSQANERKDYSFVKGHLHADILVASGEWYPRREK